MAPRLTVSGKEFGRSLSEVLMERIILDDRPDTHATWFGEDRMIMLNIKTLKGFLLMVAFGDPVSFQLVGMKAKAFGDRKPKEPLPFPWDTYGDWELFTNYALGNEGRIFPSNNNPDACRTSDVLLSQTRLTRGDYVTRVVDHLHKQLLSCGYELMENTRGTLPKCDSCLHQLNCASLAPIGEGI